jgi:hypothetical protein
LTEKKATPDNYLPAVADQIEKFILLTVNSKQRFEEARHLAGNITFAKYKLTKPNSRRRGEADE